MKICFYFVWSHSGKDMYGHDPKLWRASDFLEASPEITQMYQKYLLSALWTDFPEHHPELCDEALQDIEKLERGEIDTAEWGGEGFCHSLTRDKVTFEHAIFGECPEWPIWSCPLSHYKAALFGWRQFIGMPKAIDTELIVDLPEIA